MARRLALLICCCLSGYFEFNLGMIDVMGHVSTTGQSGNNAYPYKGT